MKITKAFGLAIMAVISIGLVSCEIENEINTPVEENYVTVNLGIAGEYIELAETPLETRAEGNGSWREERNLTHS